MDKQSCRYIINKSLYENWWVKSNNKKLQIILSETWIIYVLLISIQDINKHKEHTMLK